MTAAVVGVILNLAIWFGLHALYPSPRSLDLPATMLAALLFLGLGRWRANLLWAIAAGATFGLLRQAFPGW